jgi:hypothetical protein
MIRGTLLVAVLVLAGCSSSAGGGSRPTGSAAPPMVYVQGTVTLAGALTDRQVNAKGSTCWTPGNSPFPSASDYDDIRDGAQVVITNAHGATVGVGTLSPGTTTRFGTASNPPPCRFTFDAPDVPSGGSFYGIAVGSHSMQVTGEQLATARMVLP